jgi:hypothetical protein
MSTRFSPPLPAEIERLLDEANTRPPQAARPVLYVAFAAGRKRRNVAAFLREHWPLTLAAAFLAGMLALAVPAILWSTFHG